MSNKGIKPPMDAQPKRRQHVGVDMPTHSPSRMSASFPIIIIAPGEISSRHRIHRLVQVRGIKALGAEVHEEVYGKDGINAHHQQKDA